ncbi:hypothetical protein HJFPF1_10005 [Paramyrothecium foliicola]|nr:hypothetical protein HJFPF1_10005 [Paramyrothecium foliicola]
MTQTHHQHHHHDNPITRLVGKLRRSSESGPSYDSKDHPEKKMKKMIRTPSFRSQKAASPEANGPGTPQSKSHVSDAGLSLDLWSAAYDYLRDRSGSAGLVVAYESIISQELPEHRKIGGITTTLRDHPDSMRLDLVSSIASAGLRKRRASKASDVDEAARSILESAKDTVELMLNAYPSAALAWCGICALTPSLLQLLLDPLIQKDDIRSGVVFVTGRISFYMFLTQLLLPASWRDQKDFHSKKDEARDMVIAQYRRVLEFEMNCVCATATSWNMAAKNVVGWQGLGKLDESIREGNDELRAFIEKYCIEAVSSRLVALDRDQEVHTPTSSGFHKPKEMADAGTAGAPGAPSTGASSAGLTQIKA